MATRRKRGTMTIEEKIQRVEREISYTNSILDDIRELLNMPDEVKDFLLDISIDEDIAEETRNKAHNLWEKIY